MRQVSDFRYRVNLHEHITVEITPSVNLGRLYTANLDGHEMAKPDDGIYRFIATRPVGKTHFLIIMFDFTAAPDGSQYQVTINGDGNNNEGPFEVVIEKDDPTLDKTFQFRIVA
jgi:hypothetical protein